MPHARTIVSTDGSQHMLLAVRLEGPRGLVNGRQTLTVWLKDAKHQRYWQHSSGHTPEWLESEEAQRLVGLLA